MALRKSCWNIPSPKLCDKYREGGSNILKKIEKKVIPKLKAVFKTSTAIRYI